MGPIRRVRFTNAAQRHADIRENKGTSLGKIQVKLPHQRSPYAMKFEVRCQEKIEIQERCARGDAWRLAKNILKLKETDKATFFSPTNECSFTSPIHNKTGGKTICCRFPVQFVTIPCSSRSSRGPAPVAIAASEFSHVAELWGSHHSSATQKKRPT